MYEDKSKRKTGRTTRMLEYATRLASQGYIVTVFTASILDANNFAHFTRLKTSQLRQDHDGCHFRIGEGELRFRRADALAIGSIMKPRDINPKFIVLWDHRAIEKLYGNILAEWTRYDKGSGLAPPPA